MTKSAIEDIPHTLRVGVIVERRESDNTWVDAVWQTVEVQPELADAGVWKSLSEGDGWQRYFAGALEIELFKRETEAYKMNFSQAQPAVYVVLRSGEETDEPDVVPFLATVSPYEAEDYAESGEMIVDAVPMPAVVAAWAASFIEAYHVDQPFKKRRQKDKNDGVAGRPAMMRGGPRHDR